PQNLTQTLTTPPPNWTSLQRGPQHPHSRRAHISDDPQPRPTITALPPTDNRWIEAKWPVSEVHGYFDGQMTPLAAFSGSKSPVRRQASLRPAALRATPLARRNTRVYLRNGPLKGPPLRIGRVPEL